MKTAFIYSGQGAQYQGMGQELYQAYPIVRQTFEEASDVLHYDVAELCFSENDRLQQTEYTQPAILTVSIAFHRLLAEKGYHPDVVAGLSLGEYSAITASGALPFREALELVAKRGELMAKAVPAGVGKMVAVLNTERNIVKECCQLAAEKGVVAPANYNTPSQIVIGGEVAAVDQACMLLKERGVKRLIPLKVSGPFHTPLLEPAAEQLAFVLQEIDFKPFNIPVISNTTGQTMATTEIKSLLEKQVMSPVLWEDSIREMQTMDVDLFVEIGPGKVLSGFVRNIDRSLTTCRVEDEPTLEATLQQLATRRQA